MTDKEPQKLSYKRMPVELPTFYEYMMRRFAYANVSMRDVSLLIFGDINIVEKMIEDKDGKLTPVEKSILASQIGIAIEGIIETRNRVRFYAMSEAQQEFNSELEKFK